MNIEITDKGRAEYDALVRDAKRYGWLRDTLYTRDVWVGEAAVMLRITGCCPDIGEFDAAIDAAMGASHE